MSTGKRKEPEAENGSEVSGAGGAWTDERKAFWTACPRLGQGVVDPRPAGSSPPWVTFIPCKPPLTSASSDEFEEGDRFDATMFLERQVTARRDVGLVVGLMDQTSGVPIQIHWDDWDAEFAIIKPENARQLFGEFQKIVTSFIKRQPRRCIAVFCQDGFNLTGYCIVSYIHQAFKVPLDDALKRFAEARTPGIFHNPYRDDLHELFGGSKPREPVPAPEWASSLPPLVPPHGEFALPASRPRLAAEESAAPKPSAGSAGGAAAQLPAGWTEHWSKTHNKKYYFCKATGKQSWDFPTAAAAAPPAAAGGGGPTQVTASHILVKHSGSRKPSSWRDEQGLEITRRSAAQAQARVEELRREILAAPDPHRRFAEIARKESDCSSAKKGGDLGSFTRGKMQPPFEKAAFALPVGQISGPVASDSGVHIILRTA